MNNLHYGVMGQNPCYSWVKGWNLQKIAQNAQKSFFRGEDDVIGPKKWKILCKKLVSTKSPEFYEQFSP